MLEALVDLLIATDSFDGFLCLAASEMLADKKFDRLAILGYRGTDNQNPEYPVKITPRSNDAVISKAIWTDVNDRVVQLISGRGFIECCALELLEQTLGAFLNHNLNLAEE